MSSAIPNDARIDILSDRLDAWWDILANIKPESPAEHWKKMLSYLSPEIIIYRGSTEYHGHDGAEKWLRELLTFWAIKGREIVTQGLDRRGKSLLTTLKLDLVILGDDVPFVEAVVATFDDNDLLVGYMAYADPEPIASVIKRVQGTKSN